MPFAERIVAFGRELSAPPRFRGHGGLGAFRTYHKLPRSWWRGLGISTVLDVGANTGQFGLSARRGLPHDERYSPLFADKCVEPDRSPRPDVGSGP